MANSNVCGHARPHKALGLCRSCYEKHHRLTNTKYRYRHHAYEDGRRERNWRRGGVVLTVAQYDAILIKQDGKCANPRCATPQPYKRRLSVDHDHKTGHVRGLLCDRCNYRVVGLFEPNREWLLAYTSPDTYKK